MAIPIAYNIRNLRARKTSTLMTALGIALTVAVLLSVMAMVEGLRTSLEASGHPLHLVVMRKGATAELNSIVTPATYHELRAKPGIAVGEDGEVLASLELVTVIVLESPGNPQGININLRGLAPVGFAMRGVRLAEGRMFEPGKREVVVGRGLVNRYPAARPGGVMHFGRGEWRVVGVMDGGKSAANSEVFADLYQLASDQNRPEAMSAVLLRATDAVAARALVNDIQSDPRFNNDVVPEQEYYASQTSSAAPIRTVGMLVALIMAVGSSSILFSFFLESLFLCLLGGALGCLMVLPLNNLQTGIGSFVTFSEIIFEFRVTPAIMGIGVAFSLVIGVFGGLFPAFSASRKEILEALRQV